jgi:hypothetical protein
MFSTVMRPGSFISASTFIAGGSDASENAPGHTLRHAA